MILLFIGLLLTAVHLSQPQKRKTPDNFKVSDYRARINNSTFDKTNNLRIDASRQKIDIVRPAMGKVLNFKRPKD